uniref:PRESAN domain-containing protein n=1 Tax=Strongyloides venezuelensis TaxID=75913 RepID=A0A0K0FHY5_STRVS
MLVNFSDSKNAHDENGTHFHLADNTLMWDNDELTLQMNSEKNTLSCDESNLNFNTGSNENCDIYKNLSNEGESENFNNLIKDDTSFDDFKDDGNEKILNNIIVEVITENRGYMNEVIDEKIIEETENVDMENLKSQTLVSDEIFLLFSIKMMIKFDKTYALSYFESEKLKQFVQNKKQAQNDLWNVISTMVNMAKTSGFKYEGKHFASKQSTFNKIVDTLVKKNVEIAEKLTKILIDKGYKMNKKKMPKNWKVYLPM